MLLLDWLSCLSDMTAIDMLLPNALGNTGLAILKGPVPSARFVVECQVDTVNEIKHF